MVDVATIAFVILFPATGAATLVYLATLRRLSKWLEVNDAESWELTGRFHPFSNNTPRHAPVVLRFLFGEGASSLAPDGRHVARLARHAFVAAGILNLSMFAALVVVVRSFT